MRTLESLEEREVLALAIANEEEDSRIYQTFAERCREPFPASASVFDEMAEEERGHRDSLYEAFRTRFGLHLPPIRREDVGGFRPRRAIWLERELGPATMRKEAELMEAQAASFYDKAAAQAHDVQVRALFTHLAEVERGHGKKASDLESAHLTDDARAGEQDTEHRRFVLQYVQPGLAGLIDGSVSTLAPIFAAAFATHSNHQTLLVGLAASIGAGISMGFTEALSDDGVITGRGAPLIRGVVCGVMTAVGGLGHTLPYLIPDGWRNAFWWATGLAMVVVAAELLAIAWVRTRFMETPFLRAVVSVIIGGLLVLGVGIAIGNS